MAVKDSVVTLTGHIDTFADKQAASRAVRRVAGGKAIALELDVKLAPDHKRSDTDIATSAEQALKWNTQVQVEAIRLPPAEGERPVAAHRGALLRQAIREAQHVKIAVDGTTVTLSGTVHSWQERDAVQGVAWSAPGVRAVINELQVG